MMLIKIKSWLTNDVMYTIAANNIKSAVEALVRQGKSLDGASLDGVHLHGAYLNGASLNRAYLDGREIRDLLCLSELSDAIDLAPMVFQEWTDKGLSVAKSRFGLYQAVNEERVLIALAPGLVGGFCFVLRRREIWWWQWSCPNPNTVPVLWRDAPSPGSDG